MKKERFENFELISSVLSKRDTNTNLVLDSVFHLVHFCLDSRYITHKLFNIVELRGEVAVRVYSHIVNNKLQTINFLGQLLKLCRCLMCFQLTWRYMLGQWWWSPLDHTITPANIMQGFGLELKPFSSVGFSFKDHKTFWPLWYFQEPKVKA